MCIIYCNSGSQNEQPAPEHLPTGARFNNHTLLVGFLFKDMDSGGKICALLMDMMALPFVALVSPRETAFNLEENRNLCLECLDTAIMDTNQAQHLYIDIQRFYQGHNMNLDQQIPLRMVETQVMRETSEEYVQTVPLGRSLWVRQLFGPIMNCFRILRSYPDRKVKKILVLFGLPRLYTGMIIAHEMMHAWLILKGYSTTLDPVVEEGMCEVMAYMWLEAELSSLSSSNVMSPYNKRKLGEFLKYQYESNTSPIHGDGFRQGQQAVSKYGLKRTLEHIRETQNFPS
ncbi:protein DA1-like [Lotus japonicus]|uniref:protein DA1-like n=1 Tax=Lotus japonicus TaxID=34305 RepID=UPI0025881CD6|nr:protein DA1-like [Lotus japonicus]